MEFTNDIVDNNENLKQDIFRNLNCHQIGIIESFNAENQTATCKIATKRLIEERKDGTKIYKDYSILLDVPCIILGGGGGHLTFPISKGDECLLLFNDREIDNWFFDGGVQPFSSKRTHDFSDAIALVGLHSLKTSILNYILNGVNLVYNANSIKITDSSIDITAPIVNTKSPLTNLGDGGSAIARLGDEVTVTITSGSSAGTYKGTITTAGINTSI